jgi:RNA polymerase sigma factor (TIGR02999 family)
VLLPVFRFNHAKNWTLACAVEVTGAPKSQLHGRWLPGFLLARLAGGIFRAMSEVTRILSAIEQGDPHAAGQLLPLVYDELRRLAAQKLAQEKPGQTLDATALVHEAYLRLVGDQRFANRRHFFAAAAQAMRRILIDSARRKQLIARVGIEGLQLAARGADERLVELDDALDRLATEEPTAARIVEARVFAGLSVEEAAAALGLSRAAAYREWAFARAWLATALAGNLKKS